MTMLQKAIDLATESLAGMKDEKGNPYIEHALRVMDRMDTEEEKMAAVLHDVLEDTEMGIHDLEAYGFPKKVVDAVDQLAKRKDMTYYEYIEDVSASDLAAKIKLAEVEDNMDVMRVNKMSFKTYSLKERAEKTKKILRHELVDGER